MMKTPRFLKISGLAALGALVAFALPTRKKLTVWMVGDSTMCVYDSARFPLTGWGMPFARYFDNSVVVENRARAGRSTRTFISEGLWKKVEDSLSPGDYVLIQFGHNDEAKNYPDRYTPPANFRKNLTWMVSEVRKKKAVAVLITPVSRRKFSDAGQAMETHPVYSPIVREVAAKENVPLIDLDSLSMALYQKFGPRDAPLLFNLLKPGEDPNYPDGIVKNATHFNAYGARKIAELVLNALPSAVPALATRLVGKH
jgi:lysophospholipase L1-like esterase